MKYIGESGVRFFVILFGEFCLFREGSLIFSFVFLEAWVALRGKILGKFDGV